MLLPRGRTDQPIGSQAITYLLTVVMPVICWYTGTQPPSFFFMMRYMTPKLNYAATIGYFAAAILTGGLVYVGNSHHRLADSNEALSADVQALVEAYLTSDKDCYLLAPKPKDWLIWEEMPHKIKS